MAQILDRQKVSEIRHLLAPDTLKQRDIAASYGVSDATISRIKHGTLWKGKITMVTTEAKKAFLKSLDPDQMTRAVYAHGSVTELANQLGLSKMTVFGILRRNGLPSGTVREIRSARIEKQRLREAADAAWREAFATCQQPSLSAVQRRLKAEGKPPGPIGKLSAALGWESVLRLFGIEAD